MSDRWNIKFDINKDIDKLQPLKDGLNIDNITAALLWNRGLRDVDSAIKFIKCDEFSFYDPFLLKDMDKAILRICKAIDEKEKILIYGDYDVDGVTSVSVLYLYLQSIGADVSYYIPDRSTDGYGFNVTAIDEISSKDVNLIISVDCGTTAYNEVEYAFSKGLDVVVTDHHECTDELPKACAVVNPRRSDCSFPFKELAGVGVAFFLVCALEKTLKNGDLEVLTSELSKKYSDLVAIGTIADVMPLQDFNRYIVKEGLEVLREPKRIGISSLFDAVSAGMDKKPVTSSYISFSIAPKINAAGRMANASHAVELMLTEDESNAKALAYYLCDLNRERQSEENIIFEEAMAKIHKECDITKDSVIILSQEGWHQGVIGIVASRISEMFHMPTIMISFDENGIGKGSGRSIPGINLFDALSSCSDHLLRYGGHELAVGLSVDSNNLDAFKDCINKYFDTHKESTVTDASIDVECELKNDYISCDTIDEFALLEPFGTSNSFPLFVVKDVNILEIIGVGNDRHSKLLISKDQVIYKGIMFNVAPEDFQYARGDKVDILVSLDVNEFRGVRNPQITVKDISACDGNVLKMNEEIELYNQIIEGCRIDKSKMIVPTHKEFADAYRELVRLTKKGSNRLMITSFIRKMRWNGDHSFVKLLLIMNILSEVDLLEYKLYREYDKDTYIFNLIEPRCKTNLDKSPLYNMIRAKQK